MISNVTGIYSRHIAWRLPTHYLSERFYSRFIFSSVCMAVIPMERSKRTSRGAAKPISHCASLRMVRSVTVSVGPMETVRIAFS